MNKKRRRWMQNRGDEAVGREGGEGKEEYRREGSEKDEERRRREMNRGLMTEKQKDSSWCIGSDIVKWLKGLEESYK
jgi:hypothetical protein